MHHFQGLTGARAIQTKRFLLVQRSVRDLVRHHAMGAVHGDAGLGKTFAVEHAMRQAAVPAYRVEFPARPTMKAVAIRLLNDLTGVPHGGERLLLDEQLVHLLAEEPRLIIVDEAQRLNHECVEYLRHLHDDQRTSFALLLVGGNRCWEDVLCRHAMLKSRILRRVEFKRMTADDVMSMIPKYHPIYAETSRETLLLIDDRFAHGSWRNWASFTLTATDLCTDKGVKTVTEDIVRNAFALHGGA